MVVNVTLLGAIDMVVHCNEPYKVQTVYLFQPQSTRNAATNTPFLTENGDGFGALS